MPKPTEPFFDILADSFRDIDWDALDKKEFYRITSSISAAITGYIEENKTDLEGLKEKLEQKNIKIGKYIDNGNFAYIFELENLDGKKIDGAVIRLEQAATSNTLDSAIVIQPELVVDNGYYRASIVPKAKRVEFSEDDIKRSYSVLNAEDKITGLRDLQRGEQLAQPFMAIEMPDGSLMRHKDGKTAAVMIDLNSVKQDTTAFDGMGNVDSFLETQGWDREAFMANKAPPEDIDYLRIQQGLVGEKLREDLRAAGIVPDVPTKITDAQATEMGRDDPDRARRGV